MGGVESAFQFLGFKLDQVELKLQPTTGAVVYSQPIRPEQVMMQVRVRNPGRIAADRTYIGGLDLRIEIYGAADHRQEDRLLSVTFGIVGIFKTTSDTLDAETEGQLVRIQIPAILFPYLRAAVSTILTSAGFAGVMFPLINVHELVKGKKLEVIDLPKENDLPVTSPHSS